MPDLQTIKSQLFIIKKISQLPVFDTLLAINRSLVISGILLLRPGKQAEGISFFEKIRFTCKS